MSFSSLTLGVFYVNQVMTLGFLMSIKWLLLVFQLLFTWLHITQSIFQVLLILEELFLMTLCTPNGINHCPYDVVALCNGCVCAPTRVTTHANGHQPKSQTLNPTHSQTQVHSGTLNGIEPQPLWALPFAMGVCLHSLPMCHQKKKVSEKQSRFACLVMMMWQIGIDHKSEWIRKPQEHHFFFHYMHQRECCSGYYVKELFFKFLFLSRILIFRYLTHRKFTLNLLFALSFRIIYLF